MAAKQKRARLKRQIPGLLTQAVKRHNQQVGNIVWAWNLAHEQLYVLFAYFIQESKRASAIWHVIQSDKTQREMLLATALAALGETAPLYVEIKWLCDRVGDISTFRKDPAHTPIHVKGPLTVGFLPPLGPSEISGRPQAVERLTTKPTAQFWRAARDDLYMLGLYAWHIHYQLRYPGVIGHALPHRPSLLSLPQSTKEGRRKPRPPRGKARRPRLSSSHP